MPLSLGLFTALAAAPPAVELPPPADNRIEIVGELARPSPKEAESYLRDLGVAHGERPTARWFDDICPHAVGIPQPYSTVIETQIRTTIKSVGAPIAKRRCRPNFIIAFTDDGGALVQLMKRRGSGIGAELPAAAIAQLTGQSMPVRWWYDTDVRNRDGIPATSAPLPWLQVETDGGVSDMPTRGGTLSSYGSSNISTLAVRSIRSAVVVIDVGLTTGRPLQQVVDYATLVGLAEIRFGAAPKESILSIFKNSETPQATMAPRDVRFLQSLYRIPMDRSSSQQRRSLVSGITGR